MKKFLVVVVEVVHDSFKQALELESQWPLQRPRPTFIKLSRDSPILSAF